MFLEKIVFLLPSIKSGGGNRVVIELSNELVKAGVEVFIIYPNNSIDKCTYNIDKSIKVIPIGVLAQSKLSKLTNLKKTLSYVSDNFAGYGVPIIFTDPIMSLFSPVVRSNNKYRFIQADDYRIFDDLHILKRRSFLYIYKLLTRISYKKFNTKFIFNSQYTYDCFVHVAKKSPEYLLVHPAINHSVFNHPGANIFSSKPVIGIVARKHPLKGFIDFISALKKIDRELYSKVLVVSHDNLDDFDLSEVAVVSPHSDKEMASLFNQIDIFISTSWSEGFGLPPLEAMACGCAVIVSHSGGVNEYARNGLNCLMYEPKNVMQLADCLNILLLDHGFAKDIAGHGVKTSHSFSWDNSAQQLINVLNQA